jgi:hypothetical protein
MRREILWNLWVAALGIGGIVLLREDLGSPVVKGFILIIIAIQASNGARLGALEKRVRNLESEP